MECIVDYNFYKDFHNYIFDRKLKNRIKYFQNRYDIKTQSLDSLIKNHFVEIFCWSVIPLNILNMLNEIIKSNKITGVIDPCCGNAFHTYLFDNVLGLNTYSVDIQDEPHSWKNIIEEDGRLFIKNLSMEEHTKNLLLLSCIDNDSLTTDLLDLYEGNLVISLGNYNKLSPNYIKKLRKSFKLIKKVILKMPWNIKENLEVYLRV
jgi:hypothetical protein